ncbi:sodium/solute symporter [Planctomycetales bacterium ZRK34]|nr:sodium/solute symporter [Planctomycetales bacterium ZRK34]
MPTLAMFDRLDWIVLGGYFVVLIGASLYFTRRGQTNTTDYFLAGRRMPMWAAAMSVMATSLSAATFIGAPEESYRGDMTYISSYIGTVLGAILVAVVFIPAFYRHNVSTVYELLEVRYGVAAKRTASGMFMIGRVFASGARLYMGAIAGALIAFGEATPGNICIAIAVIVAVGTVYTFIGGIEAVVWTDVIQSFVFIGAAVVAIIVLLKMIPADGAQIIEALRHPAPDEPSKLTAFKLAGEGAGQADRYSLLSIVFGFSLIGIGAYGTDQDMTQRMLTCRSAKAGSWSAISGVLCSVPVALLFMVVGLLLWVFYQRPELMGDAAPAIGPAEDRQVFLSFILDQMPRGVSGLMMAGLFAAALSSLNSELNAMSSTLINDVYRGLRPGQSERHYLRAGRCGVVLWGLWLGGFATFCAFWQQQGDKTLLQFALSVMAFAYSGLVAVFFTALLTQRGSTASVIAALAVGFVTVLVLNLQPWTRWGMAAVDLAFTWKMLIATTLALGVCLLGHSPASGAGEYDEPSCQND